MKEKILAAITIGQAPRVDITADILPLLPQHVTLREYGALDDFTLEEIEARFAPAEGDEVLVSRMRDGRQAQFAERFVTPLVQQKIDQAEAEGADATILFCTGVFPKFRHKKLFLEPQPLFHAAVQKLADGHKVGVLVPMEEQIAQGYQFWGRAVWMWKSLALRPTAPLIGSWKRQRPSRAGSWPFSARIAWGTLWP